MLTTIWTSSDASEILFLIAVIVAAVETALLIVRGTPEAALLPAALGVVALGLLAL
jgi:hypothetical protein